MSWAILEAVYHCITAHLFYGDPSRNTSVIMVWFHVLPAFPAFSDLSANDVRTQKRMPTAMPIQVLDEKTAVEFC